MLNFSKRIHSLRQEGEEYKAKIKKEIENMAKEIDKLIGEKKLIGDSVKLQETGKEFVERELAILKRDTKQQQQQLEEEQRKARDKFDEDKENIRREEEWMKMELERLRKETSSTSLKKERQVNNLKKVKEEKEEVMKELE